MDIKFPMHKACRDGNIQWLENNISSGQDILCQEDSFYGWAPIHWAAYYGQPRVLGGLIKFGIDANMKTSRYGQTPLHVAAFGGNRECLEGLVKSGANVNIQDSMGETALHKAVRRGDIEVVIGLIKAGSDLALTNTSGSSVLEMATKHGRKDIVALFSDPKLLHQHTGVLLSGGLSNGSTGQQMFNGNNHNNNGNGHHHHNNNGHHQENDAVCRKRTFEDDEEESSMLHHHNNNNNFASPNCAKRARRCHDDDDAVQQPPVVQQQQEMARFESPPAHQLALDHDDQMVERPHHLEDEETYSRRNPSPGMDMTIPAAASPLDAVWDFARHHGYGDGESVLDDDDDAADVITDRFTPGRKGRGGVGYVLQGTKLKGWF